MKMKFINNMHLCAIVIWSGDGGGGGGGGEGATDAFIYWKL